VSPQSSQARYSSAAPSRSRMRSAASSARSW
jgi:hypothetical protein